VIAITPAWRAGAGVDDAEHAENDAKRAANAAIRAENDVIHAANGGGGVVRTKNDVKIFKE